MWFVSQSSSFGTWNELTVSYAVENAVEHEQLGNNKCKVSLQPFFILPLVREIQTHHGVLKKLRKLHSSLAPLARLVDTSCVSSSHLRIFRASAKREDA